MAVDPALAGEAFCYVTTVGRVTGREHTIEIWFGLDGDTLYMLSGGGDRSDWVKNIRKLADVRVRIGAQQFDGWARVVENAEEDALARRLLLEKYAPGSESNLSGWGRTALPVAVDLRG